MGNVIINALQFQEIVKEILLCNYRLKEHPQNNECDFVTENNIYIEVKYTKQNNFNGVMSVIRNFLAHHDLNFS